MDGEEDKFLASFMANVKLNTDDQAEIVEDKALQDKLLRIPKFLQEIVHKEDTSQFLNGFMKTFITVDEESGFKTAPPLDVCLKLRLDVLSEIDVSNDVSIIYWLRSNNNIDLSKAFISSITTIEAIRIPRRHLEPKSGSRSLLW